MNWTDEEVEDAAQRGMSEDTGQLRIGRLCAIAIMTRAVELMVARGGTMTADIEMVRSVFEAITWTENDRQHYEDALVRISSAGAVAAELHAVVDELRLQLEGAKRAAASDLDEIQRLRQDVALGMTVAHARTDERDDAREEVATLQAKVAELEQRKKVDTAHIETIEQEKRSVRSEIVELKREREGLLARLQLGTIQEQHGTILSLRAEVERLKATRSTGNDWIASDIHTVRTALEESPAWKTPGVREMTESATIRMFEFAKRTASAEAEVSRLKRVLHDLDVRWRAEQDRCVDAESRLAAIRIQLPSLSRIDRECIERALEGDAPNSPGMPDGSDEAPHETRCSGRAPDCGPGCMEHGVSGAPKEVRCTCPPITTADHRTVDHENACPLKRYPCSDTCTHDDAATPGHPERVKERSERLNEALFTTDDDREAEDAKSTEAYVARGIAYVRTTVEEWARQSFGEVPPTLKAVLDGAA